MQHYPQQNLPVEALFEPLAAALSSKGQFIVEAPPGAGKSTALPLFLLLECKLPGQIILLEPRRIAARNIARYLAQQIGEPLGEQIGYRMRGEGKESKKTRLLVVTEGVLTRMLQSDPELKGVSLVIFDEFHERSLHADLGLALCLEVQQVYNENLKLMVMSATLNSDALLSLMPDAIALRSEGRSYPIQYHYQSVARDRNWAQNFAALCIEVFNTYEGSILVFLPGAAEIKALAQRLAYLESETSSVHCLYGQLTLVEQQAAISAPAAGHRKLVLSTNIAETSLTIEGVHLVIDSGQERYAQWHSKSSSMHLSTRLICRDSATQRAGRAGRLKAGHCFRAYTQVQFDHQPAHTTPAIERSDLSELCLELASWGASSEQLAWMSPPPQSAIKRANVLLRQLGLLKTDGQVSHAGRRAMLLPISLRFAAMLVLVHSQLESSALLRRAIHIVVTLESDTRLDGLSLSQRIRHFTQLSSKAKQSSHRLERQLLRHFELDESTKQDASIDGVLLSFAFIDRIAMNRGDGVLSSSAGFGAEIKDWQQLSSSEQADYAANIIIDMYWPEGRSQATASLLCPLSLTQLEQYRPGLIQNQERCFWDQQLQKVVARTGRYLGQLCLESKAGGLISPAASQRCVIEYWQQQAWSKLPISKPALSYLDRALKAKTWFELDDWPALDPVHLHATMEQWLAPFIDGVTSYKSLQKLDWLSIIKALLSWTQQQQLEQLLPLRYKAPSGRSHVIDYSGENAKVSLKLQEVFGEPSSPLLGNKIGITLELLSPAQRPLQLTQDLASFWKNAYPSVKKEMRGRYPKHPWPDDPSTAVASHLTKKKLAL
ncbi:ATP-dependent helicase HrpB [Alginatibacterium sediminis]|uniref:ATP-dependent helicase HrpB n=1 Tax=Alginatibacterium sediminis TaxID=2164068 RepID=UPI0013146E67|nr:ATP-dependent helicase HrpB [Alginatibacterium sediminis]